MALATQTKQRGGARPGAGKKKMADEDKKQPVVFYHNGVRQQHYIPTPYLRAIGQAGKDTGGYPLEEDLAKIGRHFLRNFAELVAAKISSEK